MSILAETMPQQHIWKLLTLLSDGLGENVGLLSPKQDLIKNICNTFAFVVAELNNNTIVVHGDIRYMTQDDKTQILQFLKKFCYNEKIVFNITKEYPLINESLDNKKNQILHESYQKVSGDYLSEPLIMGAMSYARAFKRAVAPQT